MVVHTDKVGGCFLRKLDFADKLNSSPLQIPASTCSYYYTGTTFGRRGASQESIVVYMQNALL